MTQNYVSMDGAYFVIKEKVKIFFIVPIIAILSFFELPLGNAILLNCCFVGGFLCKWHQSNYTLSKEIE